MLGFLALVGGENASPLANVSAADHFWRMLPRSDPVAAQRAVSDALESLVEREDPGPGGARALLALDQHARKLGDLLLVNYLPGGAQSRSLEKRYWQSAWALARSLGHAHEHFLRHVSEQSSQRAWRDYVPALLLRLFQHRQVEALLHPFVAGQAHAIGWTGLHDAYRFAQAQGLLHQPVAVRRPHADRIAETTLEREYIHVLLLGLMNGGQLPPYEAFWANWSIPRWCEALTLETGRVNGEVDTRKGRLFVDLDSSEGLGRAAATTGTPLFVDPTPMLAAIDNEIAALRDSLSLPSGASAFGRGRQLKALRKLALVFASKPPRVSRRGERQSIESTVRAVVGLQSIVRMLRGEAHKAVAVPETVVANAIVPEVEEITITVFGGFTGNTMPSADRAIGQGRAAEAAVPCEVWQLKDRSDSGCRVRGKTSDASRLLPGVLVALNEDGSDQWALVVVRRLKRLVGEGVDIGFEYVGRNPWRVRMTAADEHGSPAAASAGAANQPFAALYLAESPRQPVLPIKTLILPAREYRRDRCLLLTSASGGFTVRLKEPIEEQGDFVWAPYEVVGRS